MSKPIPTDAAVKAWTTAIVAQVQSGNQSAKKRLRQHLRECGHRGGLKDLKFPANKTASI
jgi:hypothetical protein